MARFVVLLRGVNLAGRNRVAMARLREALEDEGYEDVSTFLQSGNVLVSSSRSAHGLGRDVERLIAQRFGLEIGVVVRTGVELRKVVERNPLATVATNPKLYQVTFLEAAPPPGLVERLEAAAVGGERVVCSGRELYAWHPDGVGRSKLAGLMSGKRLGVTGTARNWTTVAKLLELAGT